MRFLWAPLYATNRKRVRYECYVRAVQARPAGLHALGAGLNATGPNYRLVDNWELTHTLGESVDGDTLHAHAWALAARWPHGGALLARRSRRAVPLFLRFLRDRFYALFDDDPDRRVSILTEGR